MKTVDMFLRADRYKMSEKSAPQFDEKFGENFMEECMT
jgi:hypothetical protein